MMACCGTRPPPPRAPPPTQSPDRRNASSRADGVSRRGLQSLRPRGKLPRPICPWLLYGGADTLGQRYRLSVAAGTRLRDRECPVLATPIPLRRVTA